MWRLLTILALLLAVASCERTKEPGGVQLPMPAVTVKLVDPGAEPRAELRMHPHAGAKQTFALTRSMSIGTGQRASKQVVTMVYELELVAVENDEIHSRMTLRSLAVDPPLRQGKSIDSTVDSWRDARGAYVRPSLLREQDPEPPSSTAYPEMMGIAPAEPVGVGARWHEEVAQGASHASLDVELLARDGSHVRERLTYRGERAGNGMTTTFTGTATTELKLDELDGTADGSNSLVFHRDGDDVPGTETLSVRPAGSP